MEVWKLLYSWYSSDWTIVRFMKRDRTNAKAKVLELYPELHKYKAHEDESEISGSEQSESKII